jgi:hypothetical protein
MGSRGNVYVTDSSSEAYDNGARGLYIYSHWDGHELPAMVQLALEFGRERWSDDSYLMRILVDQITQSGRDQTTGYGLSFELGDNSYPITIVDLGRREVAWAHAGSEQNPKAWRDVMAFSDFVQIDQVGYPAP